MQPQFWHQQWERNQIGFHQTQVHPFLIDHWQTLAVTEGQVFVPLCGKSLDMVWLRQQGHSVLGVELSPQAVQDFFAEQSLEFSSSAIEGFQRYEGEGIELLCGDFFDLKPAQLANIQAVYDRAALIALPKELQARYAQKMLELLPHRPPILLVTFEYDATEMDGPPFSTTGQTVQDFFGQAYRIDILSEQEILEENPGLKHRGLTRLKEKTYLLSAKVARS